MIDDVRLVNTFSKCRESRELNMRDEWECPSTFGSSSPNFRVSGWAWGCQGPPCPVICQRLERLRGLLPMKDKVNPLGKLTLLSTSWPRQKLVVTIASKFPAFSSTSSLLDAVSRLSVRRRSRKRPHTTTSPIGTVARSHCSLCSTPTHASTMSGLLPKIDRSKTVKSKDYRGSSSFATFMIVGRELILCRWFLSQVNRIC